MDRLQAMGKDRRVGAIALVVVLVLVIGVAYKKDIGDIRESPALDVIRLLERRGGIVRYHDPHVPALPIDGGTLHSEPLTAQALAEADCVVIAADHSSLDYEWVVRHARKIFDTRNATARVGEGREKILRL